MLSGMKYFVSVYRFVIAFLCLAWTSVAWTTTSYWVYFTYQSNFVLGLVMLWAAIALLIDGNQPPAWLKGVLTLYIMVTGIIATVLLPPPNPATAKYVFGIVTNLILHKVVPIMASVDFLLFDPHRRFKWHYVFSWLIYFPLYLAFILIRAALWPHSGPEPHGNPYPYGFIDLPKIGLEQLVVNCAGCVVFFIVLGLLLFLIDRILPSKPLVG
ncbi:putative membrane protein [Bifidobacterium bombi DSM 19703]|uniref:Putative membrane protein n=2 Tax=Bifidobacterium bombi TaxID=471511 RepID=A0A080N2Z8_9BIFI|nr:putative membrane protein [Bifidobacterium bombi DSM 19703]